MPQSLSIRPSHVAQLERGLLRTRDLLRSGLTERSITTLVSAGDLVRLRRSWYVSGRVWGEASPRDRHLLAVIAARGAAETDPVFSHRSAATLHGLPIWSTWMESIFNEPAASPSDPNIVELTKPVRHGAVSSLLRVHRAKLEPSELDSIAGFTCTSQIRTIIDLARTEPFGIVLACADSLLNQLFSSNGVVDETSWHEWRTRLIAHTRSRYRHRGMAVVRMVAALADPHSESPLESVSRLRMHQLGVRVELQTPVPSENGGILRLDFKFPEFNMFGECDGKIKYFDAGMLNGQSAAEAVHKEKLRHDWVTGSTGMRGVRWGAKDAASTAVFARKLRAFGIEAPGRPTMEFGTEIATYLGRLP